MNSFNESGLNNEILKAISEIGYESPTPIQEKTIGHLLQTNRDLVALAQTGTGKTAAFGLPILNQIQTDNKTTQTLVLCPTRELCLQISRDIEAYSKYLKGFSVTAVYGGANIDAQIKGLKRGPQIVVGTPGRTLDLIKRKKLRIENIKWLVLDEADEMLTMGFKDDLDAILANTPETKQTLLFSATMPKEIVNIAKKYMTDAEEISVGKRNTGNADVEHEYYMVHAKDRYIALKRLADIHPDIYGIIFCRTRQETKDVSAKLSREGYNADALHGDLSQAQRDHVMERFRNKQLQLLVATDVAARGLDVNELTHVINYNLPDDIEVYVHRSGRTGRAGKKGTSIAIVHTREKSRIREIERKIKREFTAKQVPSGTEICASQLFNLIEKVKSVTVSEDQINQFLPEVYEKLEHLDREELIKHFVSAEFNRFLEYYKGARDINVSGKDRDRKDNRERDRKSDKGKGRRDRNMTRFYLNLGSRQKLTPRELISLLNENLNDKNFDIGHIDIMKSFSFFEVEKEVEKDVLKNLNGAIYGTELTELKVEISKPKDGGNGGRRRDSGRPQQGGRRKKRK